jgi:hypothetical protein
LTEAPVFKPSAVLACLRDVPINKTLAVAQIEWLTDYMQFQSTLSYLKDPPKTYALPAVDILGGLQTITNQVNTDKYTNEFDFEYDTYTLLQKTYDGHVGYTPYLIDMFVYYRNAPLVSVSDNGTDLSKVYFLCMSIILFGLSPYLPWSVSHY